MIYHVLRFSLRDDLDDGEREEVCRQIASLAKLDTCLSATVCQDLGNPADGFTHSAVILLASEQDYRDYLLDTYHTDVLEYVGPRWKKAMFCDAAEDFDPGIYDRIQQTLSEMQITPSLQAHLAEITVPARPA